MAQWSLRTKLVAAIAVAIAPAVGLAAWSTYDDIVTARASRNEAVSIAIEQAVARHRELIEGSRRMVTAACSSNEVRKALDPAASSADIQACEGYLSSMLQKFPAQYS